MTVSLLRFDECSIGTLHIPVMIFYITSTILPFYLITVLVELHIALDETHSGSTVLSAELYMSHAECQEISCQDGRQWMAERSKC